MPLKSTFRARLSACGLAALTLTLALPTVADVGAIKIARSFSLGHLPAIVMEQQKLVEKHARDLAVPDLKVEWVTLAGAAAQNDALLSGSVAFTANGVPGLLLLWDKTHGEVRGVGALNSGKQLLNARNPSVRSISDFTPQDKIAVPAVKVSVGAILLQMAAEKQFGEQNRNKLDALTVGLSHPDATAALLSNSEVTAHYALEPYSSKELTVPGIHTVLDSDDTPAVRERGRFFGDTGEHDEVRYVHVSGRYPQDEAAELEGLLFPGDSRAQRKLTGAAQKHSGEHSMHEPLASQAARPWFGHSRGSGAGGPQVPR
jgi:ABC-type nitrate/sulfonate/bicarbonate transport system substrate-binding protein